MRAVPIAVNRWLPSRRMSFLEDFIDGVTVSQDVSSQRFTYMAPRGPGLNNVVDVGIGLSVGDQLPIVWPMVKISERVRQGPAGAETVGGLKQSTCSFIGESQNWGKMSVLGALYWRTWLSLAFVAMRTLILALSAGVVRVAVSWVPFTLWTSGENEW